MKAVEWYRIEAKADDTAELSIFGPIGGGFFADEDAVTGKRVAAQLDALPTAVKTIRVLVNSPGGAVFDALHIANALRRQSTEKGRTVEVLVEGLAASAATLITSAGDAIKVPKNALLMVHMPSGVALGPASAMRKVADALDRVAGGIVATYRWVSSKSPTELLALMEATTWMTAEEAVANGFATEVIEATPARACLEPDMLTALGQPPEVYRAAVDALVAKPAAPPVAAEAAAIIRACKAAGFPEVAEDLLGQPMDAVTARLAQEQAARAAHEARATEIRALCATARLPELAEGYLAGGMPVAAVKAHLTTITARLDRVEIDTGLTPDAGTAAVRLEFNALDVYRELNRLPARQGA